MYSDLPDPQLDVATPRLFRPHLFFWKPWWGTGEVRRTDGRLVAKYRLEGHGHADRHSGYMAQTAIFEDGSTQPLEWEIVQDDPERYIARDRISGAVARGRAHGRFFTWSFWRTHPSRFGKLPIKLTVTYEMASRTTVASRGIMRLWGLIPVMRMTAHYSHVG